MRLILKVNLLKLFLDFVPSSRADVSSVGVFVGDENTHKAAWKIHVNKIRVTSHKLAVTLK